MKQTALKAFKPSARVLVLVLLAWAASGMVDGVLASSPKAMDQPVIKVRIYNYANVDRLELHEGESQTAELFAKAGVRIAWTDYSPNSHMIPAQPEDSEADFFLRILPASMARHWNYKARALGESVVPPGFEGPLPGGFANVFYDRVKHVSTLWDMFPGEVLGDAMAHELGHLLLGPQHSPQGILKALWTFRDLELAKLGKLQFSPGEMPRLRSAALSLRNDPSLTVTAQR
jgi:hypothetical protein